MNYSNFLRLSLCFLLHVFSLYSSEKEGPSESWWERLRTRTNNPLARETAYPPWGRTSIDFRKAEAIIANQKPEANPCDESSCIINQRGIAGYSPLERMCRPRNFFHYNFSKYHHSEEERTRIANFLLSQGASNGSIRDAFYSCFASNRDTKVFKKRMIRMLLPHLSPPYRNDYLSKNYGFFSMKSILKRIIHRDESQLTELFLYRNNFGEFTVSRAHKLIDKFPDKLRTRQRSIEEVREMGYPIMELNRSDIETYEKITIETEYPLTWTCMNPLSQIERLEIAKLFLVKGTPQHIIKDALQDCLLNKRYNSEIIPLLQSHLEPESSE